MNLLKKILSMFFGLSKVTFTGDRPRTSELYRKYIAIAWPAVLEGALISIIGSIDTMMVGKLGYTSITAVGLTNQPRMIMLIVCQATCVGITAVIARRKGAGNREAANAAFSQSFGVVTLIGIAMVLIGYTIAPYFMEFAGAKEDTIEEATIYFRFISLAFLFNAWNLAICAAMRAIGNTRITLITNLTANLVNVVLNYCLIEGHFGFPALGVKGAAIATAIGTSVGSMIALVVALRGGYLKLQLPKIFHFEKDVLRSVWKVGSASIAEAVFLRAGFMMNAKMVAGIGTHAFASYQIVMQVTSLSFTLGDGLGTAATTLIGQSLGARRKDLAKANVSIARKLGILTAILLILVLVTLHRQLGMLFSDEEIILQGVSMSFFVICFAMISQNARVVFSGCLRGAGDTRYVAMVSLISVCTLRVIVTYLFCYPIHNLFPTVGFDIVGAWIAFDVDAMLRHFLYQRRIKRGKWADIEI